MTKLLRSPVFRITALAFAVVAVSTGSVLLAAAFLFLLFPLVLLAQWLIGWVFRCFHSPVWLRRTVVLLPAMLLAGDLFLETNMWGGQQKAAIKVALAGHVPSGMSDVHVNERAFVDYMVDAYFRCDPASLRGILEKPPFKRSSYQPGVLSFDRSPFADLRQRPDVQNVIVFERIDLNSKGSCQVCTDASFSFASVSYGVD